MTRSHYQIARWHFAAAQYYLGSLDASDVVGADWAAAGAALAEAHLRAAEFARSWDTYFGGDLT